MSDVFSAHSAEEVDCTLEGSWASLWKEQMNVGKGGLKPGPYWRGRTTPGNNEIIPLISSSSVGLYSQEPYNHFQNIKLQTFSGTEMCVCKGPHTKV